MSILLIKNSRKLNVGPFRFRWSDDVRVRGRRFGSESTSGFPQTDCCSGWRFGPTHFPQKRHRFSTVLLLLTFLFIIHPTLNITSFYYYYYCCCCLLYNVCVRFLLFKFVSKNRWIFNWKNKYIVFGLLF